MRGDDDESGCSGKVELQVPDPEILDGWPKTDMGPDPRELIRLLLSDTSQSGALGAGNVEEDYYLDTSDAAQPLRERTGGVLIVVALDVHRTTRPDQSYLVTSSGGRT